MSDTTSSEIKAAQQARREKRQLESSQQRPESESDKASLKGISYDTDIFEGKGSRFANYDLSIDVGGNSGNGNGDRMEDDDVDDEGNSNKVSYLDSCKYLFFLLSLSLLQTRILIIIINNK